MESCGGGGLLQREQWLAQELADCSDDSDAFVSFLVKWVLNRLLPGSPCLLISQPQVERCLIKIDERTPVCDYFRQPDREVFHGDGGPRQRLLVDVANR